MSEANSRQVGGDHYQGEIQHWDYAWSRQFDQFQYIITKWVDRHKKKGGLQDLRKARHALDKYIELLEAEAAKQQGIKAGALKSYSDLVRESQEGDAGLTLNEQGTMVPTRALKEAIEGEEPGPGYVNQD